MTIKHSILIFISQNKLHLFYKTFRSILRQHKIEQKQYTHQSLHSIYNIYIKYFITYMLFVSFIKTFSNFFQVKTIKSKLHDLFLASDTKSLTSSASSLLLSIHFRLIDLVKIHYQHYGLNIARKYKDHMIKLLKLPYVIHLSTHNSLNFDIDERIIELIYH